MAKQKKETLSERDIEVRANAEADLEAMLSARNVSAETEEEAPEEEETDEKVAVELPQRKAGKNSK